VPYSSSELGLTHRNTNTGKTRTCGICCCLVFDSTIPVFKWSGKQFGVKGRQCRVIAQAVSRRLPIAAARVRAQVRSCGICGGQSGTGVGFFRVLRFPLPILIPQIAPHSSSIIRGCYIRPISGRRTKWTQSHPTPRN
jgi:hypothetical protein